MAEFIIHRGSHQIGGMCAEVRTETSRVIIDMGTNLPGNASTAISDRELLESIFENTSTLKAILFTHYHGDHIGIIDDLIENKISKSKNYIQSLKKCQLYLGPTAIKVKKTLWKYTGGNKSDIINFEKLEPKELKFGNIIITPIRINHSAIDSFMFLIKADGKTMLYTGDFRNHGHYLSDFESINFGDKVDYLVTEGTMFSRTDAKSMDNKILTENELVNRAEQRFSDSKYNFILVSSTNFDSILSFYKAKPKGMKLICDEYQFEQLNNAKDFYSEYNINFSTDDIIIIKSDNFNFEPYLETGFVMLVRTTTKFVALIKNFFDRFTLVQEQCSFIYSMWKGYIQKDIYGDELLRSDNYSKSINDFIKTVENYTGHKFLCDGYHTSGHASIECINKLIDKVKPEYIIPMHSEKTDDAKLILKCTDEETRIMILHDGDVLNMNEPDKKRESIYSHIYKFKGMDYHELAEKVIGALNSSDNISIWTSNFKRYIEEGKFEEKRQFLDEHKIIADIHPPLYVYSPISAGIKTIQIRHSGALISHITYQGDDRQWELYREDAAAYFTTSNGKNLYSKIAPKEKRYGIGWHEAKGMLADINPNTSILGKEHRIESLIHTAIENNKFAGLKPVHLVKGCRFQMPVPLNASQIATKDFFKFLKMGKGNIDILAKDSKDILTVIELKDSYHDEESPEKAIKQAIIYAAFMGKLLNTSDAGNWAEQLGITNLKEINAVICMPYKSELKTDFGGTSINVSEKNAAMSFKINLHYIYFNKTEDDVICEKTSLSLS